MEKYIPLIVGGVFALFILFGLFWGLVRGLKKTSFRAIWIVVTAIILLLVTPILTKAVMNIPLPFLSIEVEGQTLSTLNQLAVYYIKQIPDYGELLASSTESINAVVTLVTLVVNAFIFVILFWAVKIALWPIWAIIAGIVIKKKDKDGNKKPRKRGWGMLVGAVTGLFVGATTLMPVLGIVNVAYDIEKSTEKTYTKTIINENGEEEEVDYTAGELSKLGIGDVMVYLNAYGDSSTAKILKYTGVQAYQNFMFNTLSTGKAGNEKIVLKDEVKTVLVTVGNVRALMETDFSTLTKENVTALISAAKTIVNDVFNIKTIKVIGDDLFSIVLNDMVTNPNSVIKLPSTGMVAIDDGIKQGVTELKNFKFSDLKNEILAILDIAETLNKKDIICKIANKEAEQPQQIIALFDNDTLNTITDDLFQMQTMSTFLPIAVNSGLEYVAELIQAEGFSINDNQATIEEVKTMFKSILTSVLAVSNTLDFESQYYITENSLPKVGKVLDAIKNYGGLDQTNYNILINQVENKLYNTLAKSFEDLDEEMEGIKNNVLNSIRNLSNVTNFETEFTKVNACYTPLMNIVENASGSEINVSGSDLGKVLDAFKSTQMFGSSVNPIMESVLDFAKTIVPEEFADLKIVVERAKQKVANVQSWETELTCLGNFVDAVRKVLDSEDLQTEILAADSTILTDLGKELDKLSNSTLLGGEIKNIVKVLIDQFSGFESGNEGMLTACVNQIKTNLENAQTINWEKEFGIIKKLINALMELAADEETTSESMASIGAKLDEVLEQQRVLVNRAVINTMIDSAVDQFAGDIETGSDMEDIIQTIKNEIKTNQTLSFEQELKALNVLITELNDIDMDTFGYADFGALLDSFDSESGSNKSVVVSAVRPKIVKMILNEVDTTSMDADMVAILEKMKLNCGNITNYENEFTLLEDFVDTVDNLTTVDVNTFDFAGFGAKMDGYKNSALIGPVRTDILEFIVNKVTITSSKPDIQTSIDNILDYTIECGNKVETQELTYTQIFTDLGKLKDLTDSFTNVDVERDNPNSIKMLGEKLNELNELCIVPTSEVVRIGKYVTTEIVSDTGLKSIIPSEHLNNEQIKEIYDSSIEKVEELKTKYSNYLENIDTTQFNFATDFELIKNSIINIDDALKGLGA